MIPVAAAQAAVLALARPTETETVALAAARGRALAADVVARADQPPFAAAAMDGWALADPAAPGDTFRILGTAHAGAAYRGRLGAGEAVRIFTGAPIPEGATRVVLQEDAVAADGRVTLRAVEPAAHVRPRGGDFPAGFVLRAGRRLRPADLALIAAMRHGAVAVRRRPLVALIPTGDELVLPGEPAGPDQIACSSTFALAAMAEAEGAAVRHLPIARDDPAALGRLIGLAADADVIVTAGGASVGDSDLVRPVTDALGIDRAFSRIAMRPGKPLQAGLLGRAAFLALPGNPVSAIVCGVLFLLPLLRAMQGLPPLPRLQAGVLARELPANGPRDHYMRARLLPGAPPVLDPFEDQDSARLRLLAEADALAIRPAGAGPARRGDAVEWLALDP